MDDLSEPEELIINGGNDEELCKLMPDYWLANAIGRINICIDRSRKEKSERYKIEVGYDKDANFYGGIGFSGIFVSEKAKNWLDVNFPKHFEYYEIHSC